MATKKVDTSWSNIHKYMTKDGIERSFLANRQYTLAKDQYTTTLHDDFIALAIAVRDRLIERWISTQQGYHKNNVKRVYYLSLEFLIGRLLGTNMQNLGLWDECQEAMDDLGLDLDELKDCEPDAGLGNGGLGRLAACFLDSMATMNIPAHGYGIRYEYGIFKQKIINGQQVELPDEWLSKGNPWEFQRSEHNARVHFYGRTYMYTDENGRLRVKWADTEDVLATPYDIPIAGYKSDCVNTLRLWSARSSEDFNLGYFNDGDYERAVYNQVFSETISKVLYPNDNVSQGKELRLKQEYFFTSASISDILRRFKVEENEIKNFPEKVCIQLNDTHPALAVLELMRVLIDEENLDWDLAWDIVRRTFAYTNHTVMPEALECWKISMFEKLLPRHMQLIYEINMRFLREVTLKFPGDNDLLKRVSLIEEGDSRKIRMAFLCIIGSHSINGVSWLHSELLKTQLFRDFYLIYPEKFNNKTNGITQRRWLLKSNRGLAGLISEAIGDKWAVDYKQMENLLPFKAETSFCQRWQEIKKENKVFLADYIFNTMGIKVNPNSMFDVQIKRIHEYKRQFLFALYIISQYLKVKQNPQAEFVPRTFILAGKSAPGYYMAKLVIKFINSIADVVNNDKSIGDKIKIVFLENYRVSLAEKIFPASDLSEQISTAGTEASGTGCMKFMMNGALTMGTYDGANIEIAQAVGLDNIFVFGLKVEEISALWQKGYNPQEYINGIPVLKEVINLVRSNFFSHVDHGIFDNLVNSVVYDDRYLVCADFEDYLRAQDKASLLYLDQQSWTEKAIINVAKSGVFSSDRTIMEYAKEIWKIA